MTKETIAVIGAGNMGASLVGGLINTNYPREKIWVSDPTPEKLNPLQTQFQVHTTQKNSEALEHADIVIFAIKPQIFKSVTEEVAKIILGKKPLIISVAAGIREGSMQKWLNGKIPIVRAMPNTPALLGCGATALYANEFVSKEQCDLAESILRAVSTVVWIKEEKLMDVVTALSGCGPAYFFLIMEALEKSAHEFGLPKNIAHILTLQTALGAARMALESDVGVEILRQRVASPGGATEKALAVLEEHKIHEIFKKAVEAATKHSGELATKFDTRE